MPIIVDGKRKKLTFNCEKDVWDAIDLIIEETNRVNREEGGNIDIATSVVSQIAFFACPNILIDETIHRDLKRYIYCEKFGVAPYPGSYGEQPFEWIERAFLIKSALAKKQKRDIDVARKNNN